MRSTSVRSLCSSRILGMLGRAGGSVESGIMPAAFETKPAASLFVASLAPIIERRRPLQGVFGAWGELRLGRRSSTRRQSGRNRYGEFRRFERQVDLALVGF